MGSMFTLFFGKRGVKNLDDALQVDSKMYAELFRFLLNEGIYIPPSPHEAWFVSSAHEETHLKATSEAILTFLKEVDTL